MVDSRRALFLATTLVIAACGGPTPSPSAEPSASPSAVASAASASSVPGRRIASSGWIAVLAGDGSLGVVSAAGDVAILADASEGAHGFPTWSPDGSKIAVTRSNGTENAIVVFDAGTAPTLAPTEPVVILRSSAIGPFYLYWTPDGRSVTYLANDGDSLALRIAPADGSAPVDGSGANAVVRRGEPFYYDWVEPDRLLAHIGAGTEAFLGELGLDGRSAEPTLGVPGDFRSVAVARDHGSIAFVRMGTDSPGEVVVAARDGSHPHAAAVFGAAAVAFDPAGERIATIGPTLPEQRRAVFPLGPLRLIDEASGDVRTLVDGDVLSFWWSPDGRTIAALRVQPKIGSAASTEPGASAGEPMTEARLLFVDVETGRIRSQPVVQPSPRFIESYLAFFDQYALSHRVWAPDSSSMLLPEVFPDGSTRITVYFPDGEPPIGIEGEIAFWSP